MRIHLSIITGTSSSSAIVLQCRITADRHRLRLFRGFGLGAEVVARSGEVWIPEPPGVVAWLKDAGVGGPVAGKGLAPLPLPGALTFARLKGLKGSGISSSGMNE